MLILASCNQEEQFSCNQAIDKYVKDHASELEIMDLQDLLVEDREVRKAAFRMYTPQKRYSMWKAKFQLYRESNLNLSAQELIHLAELENLLSVEIFNPKNEKGRKTFFKEIDQWARKAKRQFNWTNDYLYFLVSSLNYEGNSFEKEILAVREQRILNGESEAVQRSNFSQACKCDVGGGFVVFEDCFLGAPCENSLTCDRTLLGCVEFFTRQCDGLCDFSQPPGGDDPDCPGCPVPGPANYGDSLDVRS